MFILYKKIIALDFIFNRRCTQGFSYIQYIYILCSQKVAKLLQTILFTYKMVNYSSDKRPLINRILSNICKGQLIVRFYGIVRRDIRSYLSGIGNLILQLTARAGQFTNCVLHTRHSSMGHLITSTGLSVLLRKDPLL